MTMANIKSQHTHTHTHMDRHSHTYTLKLTHSLTRYPALDSCLCGRLSDVVCPTLGPALSLSPSFSLFLSLSPCALREAVICAYKTANGKTAEGF